MKVLVTGFGGQLGHDVIKHLEALDIECRGVDIADFDITNEEQTLSYITDYAPDVVVHCSAYTAVDKAEENMDLCYAVNAKGPEYIAKACKKIDAKMVYISTDYVFPGQGTDFYEVDDQTGPLSQYGATKLSGEQAVKAQLEKYFIIRISWVFGVNGNNFVKTMLRLGREKEELRVVDDQIGSPTYTDDLSVLICKMIQTEKYGTYHATNEGICSWAQFTEEIFKQTGITCKVTHVTTQEYGATVAVRPENSRMSKKSLDEAGFDRLPTWQDALHRYLIELGQISK